MPQHNSHSILTMLFPLDGSNRGVALCPPPIQGSYSLALITQTMQRLSILDLFLFIPLYFPLFLYLYIFLFYLFYLSLLGSPLRWPRGEPPPDVVSGEKVTLPSSFIALRREAITTMIFFPFLFCVLCKLCFISSWALDKHEVVMPEPPVTLREHHCQRP